MVSLMILAIINQKDMVSVAVYRPRHDYAMEKQRMSCGRRAFVTLTIYLQSE